MFRTIILLLFLLTPVLSANQLFAYPEYAERTGSSCEVCHPDPAGGGGLTAEGRGYALALGLAEAVDGDDAGKSALDEVVRFIVGYLHILFGFFWFGTILYVHLILKPAYASRGLPRGEVKLGLLSMVVMGVTGAILFVDRVPDAAMLVETRFGVLLLVKIILYGVMVCSALFAVFFLGPRLRRRKAAAASASSPENLSLENLAGYDGQEGRPAYFAYRGDIYNASDSPLWKNGAHMGRHQAGTDLTESLAQAPHGEEQILALPKVGTVAAEQEAGMTPPQRVFYAMAYLNLGFVLLILLVLAAWNWW